MLIGLSGKKQSGKDTVCEIIQYLTTYPNSLDKTDGVNRSFNSFSMDMGMGYDSNWQRKLFANKLKEIVCLLLNCTMEQLENSEFKEKELGEEWNKELSYTSFYPDHPRQKMTPRLLLQLLGTECGRDIIHPNIWVNALFADYRAEDAGIISGKDYKENNWIITDVRFENEAKAIKDRGGILIRIERLYPYIGAIVKPTNDWGSNKSILDSNGIILQIDVDEILIRGKVNKVNTDIWVYNHEVEQVVDTHSSETSLDDYKGFDSIIMNNGTIEELIQCVKEVLQTLKII